MFALRLFIMVILVLWSGWAMPSHAEGQASLDYTILISGRPSGTVVVTTSTPNQRQIRYAVNDRGRGAEHVTTVSLDQNMHPHRLTIEGVNYLKVPFREQFTTTAERAHWQSAVDKGEARSPGFYLPNERIEAHEALLAAALLATPSRTLPLLPSGTARLEAIRQETVKAPGQSHHVTLYLIHGLNFSPLPLWLDEAGQLFQAGHSWITVRKGWESEAERLADIQRIALAEQGRHLAQQLAKPSATPLAFQNVALFDPQSKALRTNQTVLVQGNRIQAVAPQGELTIPTGAVLIDGRGKTLLPGLWDMHVHVSNDNDGLWFLGNGITSVRDLGTVGANIQTLIDRREAFAKRTLVGPRIIMGALIDGPGPFAAPTKLIVDTPEATRALIQSLAGQGYEQIKIYSSLNPKLVPIVVEEAHRLGMRVSGHIPATMTMTDAINAGFDEVQHANFWLLNFMGADVAAKINSIVRFTAVGERGKDIDLSSPQVQAFVDLIAQKKVVVDPTLSPLESLLTARDGILAPDVRPIFERLPPVVQRERLSGGLATQDNHALYALSYQTMVTLLKRMYDAGITIVPGTDSPVGFSLIHELEIYAQAGIPKGEVLAMATLGAARVMKKDQELGSIAPGKLADLILVEGDPTQDIGVLRNLMYVIKDGALYDPNALLGAIGVAPRQKAIGHDISR